MFLAGKTGGNLVKLCNDITFLLKLLLLVAFDRLSLICFIQIKSVTGTSAKFTAHFEHAIVSIDLFALFGLELTFNVVNIMPVSLVGV